MLSLDADKMQEVCLNLILNEVGNQCGKTIAAYVIGIIATQLRRNYDGVDAESYDELSNALKDVFNKYAKEYPANSKLDRFSLSTLVETMSTVGVHDLSDELEKSVRHLFKEGYIEENIINEEDAIDGMYNHGWDSDVPVTDVRELLFPSID